MRGEEEETNQVKSEREKRPLEAKIAVSVLAFISASIVGDAKSVSFEPRLTETNRERGDEGDEDSRA